MTSKVPLTHIQKELLAHLVENHDGCFDVGALYRDKDGVALGMPFSIISLRSLVAKGMVSNSPELGYSVTHKGRTNNERE